ncbi:twin-arginine translocation protein, TatA/E family subunit [Halostagnicola larsenii XH-48]|uniref:Twin-arginine translocation protein, TatA/E family subunit n=1 Tax=Halostagnicola larsenii XH-48 TaxID=797299 RepID=W0JNZ9_9EURY|nr:twin-arginine translocase TatA/TatE family subunit [Halostagnicola larsenii]AHF99026.1 twin-arginine translocation protein, TatA/E family subunit [Halostagnicola larsenii XH-48]
MAFETAPLFAPIPGGTELLVILFIAILLFGANKIPKLARSTGEAMGEFQKGREKVETELEEMRETGTYDDVDDEEEESDFVDTEPVTSENDTATDAKTETETESN